MHRSLKPLRRAALGGRGAGPPVLGGDAERAEVLRSGPPSANGAGPAAAYLAAPDITKRHGAPGLLVLAGALGGLRAWRSLKRSLPQARPKLARTQLTTAAYESRGFEVSRKRWIWACSSG